MSDQFLGEIRMFAGNFAPKGWAFCNGQLLPIAQNTALFSLLGTTYGGNGTTNFALPDLKDRAPMHYGQGPGLQTYDLGQQGGATTVALTVNELPAHSHRAGCDTTVTNLSTSPTGAVWTGGGRGGVNLYSTGGTLQNETNMNSMALGPTGGDYPHNNVQPYLALTFIIALEGAFPPRG